MNREEIENILEFHDGIGSIPSIMHYGDTLWRKGWFGYTREQLPGGREYTSDHSVTPPKIKAKRNQLVTREDTGISFHGAGAIAANLTEVGNKNLFDSLVLIFNSDPNAAGIAFSDKQWRILGWIDRSDVPNLQ